MINGWQEETLSSADDVLNTLHKYRLKPNLWLFRGSSKTYETLLPSIDRDRLIGVERKTKISLERQSIEVFRLLYSNLASSEEKQLLKQDITTLMLMQHFEAKTRLLDWSFNPFIAAYFSVCNQEYDEESEGLIWAFQYHQYLIKGGAQWGQHPEMHDCKGEFKDYLQPAFEEDYKGDWFVCQFLHKYNFSRIISQDGLFTFSSQFDIDHAERIRQLLADPSCHKVFVVNKEAKRELRNKLRNDLRIWHGKLFPDAFGTAKAVNELLVDTFLQKKDGEKPSP